MPQLISVGRGTFFAERFWDFENFSPESRSLSQPSDVNGTSRPREDRERRNAESQVSQSHRPPKYSPVNSFLGSSRNMIIN